jgi:hypothetical protein
MSFRHPQFPCLAALVAHEPHGPLLGVQLPFSAQNATTLMFLTPCLSDGSVPNPTRIGGAHTTISAASALRASSAMAEPEVAAAAAPEMETEAPAAAGQKREREEAGDGAPEGGEAAVAEEEAAAAKKQKVERESKEGEEGKPVKLGPKEFASSVEMFDYFFALLHSWSPQLDFNKVRARLRSSLVVTRWSGYMKFLHLRRFAMTMTAVALFAD